MRIRHENTAAGDQLVADGQEYTADEHGWFDVPHAFGAVQARFAGWRQYLGEEAAKVEHAVETVAEDVKARLEAEVASAKEELAKAVERIRELEGELAKKAAPAKAPAAKKAAAKDGDSSES